MILAVLIKHSQTNCPALEGMSWLQLQFTIINTKHVSTTDSFDLLML